MSKVTSAVAVALLGAVACDRAPDTDERLRQALDQANMQAVTADVDADANVVHLKGAVENMSERTRAGEVAAAVVGTSGQVLNEVTVRGLNDETAGALDDQIEDTLDRTIDRDPVLKERDVNFEVANGMVVVKGWVRSATERSRVEELVKAAPGVKDVANALEIKGTD
jgi:osmotically-inducible protein OsmY